MNKDSLHCYCTIANSTDNMKGDLQTRVFTTFSVRYSLNLQQKYSRNQSKRLQTQKRERGEKGKRRKKERKRSKKRKKQCLITTLHYYPFKIL